MKEAATMKQAEKQGKILLSVIPFALPGSQPIFVMITMQGETEALHQF